MSNEKQTVLAALGQYRSDDLQRAQRAFRGFSAKEMQEQHGQSGMTRQQILDSYVAFNEKVDAAVRWVESK